MRTHMLLLFPLAAAIGCAHQSSDQQAAAATPTASPPAVATTSPAAEPPPAAEAPPSKEATEPRVAESGSIPCPAVRVQFAFDSDAIPDGDKPQLDSAAHCLSSNDRLRVSIEGNADEIGSQDYNLDLGERRAESVATYLKERGVAREQLQAVISHGEDNPVCDERDEACYARNRRTAVRATCHL